MSQRGIGCPGCLYSGQPHLTTCEVKKVLHLVPWWQPLTKEVQKQKHLSDVAIVNQHVRVK